MSSSSGYDAALVVCPVHRTPVYYKPGERFDPMGEVACQDSTCTALADQEAAVSDLLATGRAELPGGIVLDFTGSPSASDRTAEGPAIYLAVGETCLDCSSTALVGHWHTGTDCLVARTGWGGP